MRKIQANSQMVSKFSLFTAFYGLLKLFNYFEENSTRPNYFVIKPLKVIVVLGVRRTVTSRSRVIKRQITSGLFFQLFFSNVFIDQAQ